MTNTLLLCLCIVVTSHAQIGIHLSANGDVGIGDDTPYSRLTMSGPIGFNTGDFPAFFMYEDGSDPPSRQILAHSPDYPDRGLRYNPVNTTFLFGDDLGGIWLNSNIPSLGIGFSNPDNSLVVAGSGNTIPPILRIGNKGGFDQPNSGAIIFDEDLEANLFQDNFCGIAMRYNGFTNQLEFLGDCGNDTDLDNANLLMTMARSGNIGIGVLPDTTYRLQIAGQVRAKEIVVESGWADYVFDDTYQLRPLEEVEQFIREYKHLPGIPDAIQVRSNGLAIANTSRLMMEKIEELTLYAIAQEKTIGRQQEFLETLFNEIQTLREEVNNLKED